MSTGPYRFSTSLTFLVSALLTVSGCANPKLNTLLHDARLDKNGGPLLVVDVCIAHDAIGDANDYYMITESKAAATAMISAAGRLLFEKGVNVREGVAPYVCGVLVGDSEAAFPLMQTVGAERTWAQRPFSPSPAMLADTEYATALSVLSTVGYKQGAEKDLARFLYTEHEARRPKFSRHYSQSEVRDAAAVVARKSQASSAVFISVLAYTQSSEKSNAITAGRILGGVASLLVSRGGFLLIPGGAVDGRTMTASAFDLTDGTMFWAESFHVNAESRSPEGITVAAGVSRLLHDLLHEPDNRLPRPNQPFQ